MNSAEQTSGDAARAERAQNQQSADSHVWTLKALARSAIRAAYLGVSPILRALNIRFLRSDYPHGMGHQVSEIDFILKSIALGKQPRRRLVLLVEPEKLANVAVPELWRGRIKVIRHPFWVRLLRPFERLSSLSIATSEPFVKAFNAYVPLVSEWNERPPVIGLPDAWRASAEAALERWGMRRGGWFVAVHCREGGYRSRAEPTNSFRNASIENYLPAMTEIVARGGFVVRLGDPSMRPLPATPGVYDYALSAEREPHLDLALGAMCRFFVGTTSGPIGVANMFNTPCALTNMIPCGMAPGIGPRDVSITKIVKWADGRILSFRDAFHHRVSNWRETGHFVNARFEVLENTPDEIRDLVIEMIERLEGRFEASAEEQRLQALFKSRLTPEDYCFGSQANVCGAFLRKYAAHI